jgi:hypothetical protein
MFVFCLIVTLSLGLASKFAWKEIKPTFNASYSSFSFNRVFLCENAGYIKSTQFLNLLLIDGSKTSWIPSPSFSPELPPKLKDTSDSAGLNVPLAKLKSKVG